MTTIEVSLSDIQDFIIERTVIYSKRIDRPNTDTQTILPLSITDRTWINRTLFEAAADVFNIMSGYSGGIDDPFSFVPWEAITADMTTITVDTTGITADATGTEGKIVFKFNEHTNYDANVQNETIGQAVEGSLVAFVCWRWFEMKGDYQSAAIEKRQYDRHMSKILRKIEQFKVSGRKYRAF